MSAERAFLDTNVLVYLFDRDAPEKQAVARAILTDRYDADALVLSTQVLQEFYVSVTHKLAAPLSAEDAHRALQDLAEFPVVQIDTAMVLAAVIATRWFDARRGLVMGLLSAANATGQLIFLTPLAAVVEWSNWRSAALIVAAAAAIVFVLVALFMRDRPADLGLGPYGQATDAPLATPPKAMTPLRALGEASRTRAIGEPLSQASRSSASVRLRNWRSTRRFIAGSFWTPWRSTRS